MEKKNKLKMADIFRKAARYSLLVIGVLVFGFALDSGAEEYGGGINGIIKNSPNAIPWLSLILLVIIAWKWELTGGIIITLFGLAMLYFFNFHGPNFWWSTFIITLLIPLLGSFFLLSWYLRRD
jgi:hypothetical protein